MNTAWFILPLATPDGEFLARYSATGLVALHFPSAEGSLPSAPCTTTATRPRALRVWHRLTTAALLAQLAGHAGQPLPPLDWAGRTEFQQAVWRELLKIAPGQTRSYGEIARLISRPQAVRAVGGACGANPIPVLVPCHRVLAAHQKLGGFSGGLAWKQTLLAREGISWLA